MYYGGDYNPEQWDEATWHEDVLLMRKANVTMVSLGIFAWSRIQPDEQTFDLEWLDRVIDLLHENGIAVDLATATASPPAWAVTAYPGMRPQDENGAIYWQGSRQHYAPSSPDYRRLAARLVTELANRYVSHPAVALWHVNNEYGCHIAYDYSDTSATAFRVWLEAKYGTVDALNVAWGTMFWSQRYSSFDEIVPPRKAPYSQNPCGMLDFRRFTSDTLLSLYTMERDIIKAAGATQPVTTNFMGLFPSADYWKWAKEIDVISDDSYPDPNDPESFRSAALTRDLMRSFKPGTPWLLMEQASNALSWRPTNAPKAPGQMAALSMQAVGRGADGIFFFQWRQSRKGSEKFHSAMLPHAGTGGRTWREIIALGGTLAGLPELPDPGRARVAIVLEWDNWWALANPDHPIVLDYAALIQRWYKAFHRQHVSVDFVQSTSDLAGYALILLPQAYLLSDSGAANLAGFVNGGGNLLVIAFSDVVDEYDAFRDGGFTMGLRDVLGVAVEEFGALVPPNAGGARSPGEDHAPVAAPFGELRGEYFAEELLLLDESTTVLGDFSGGRLNGSPALTVRTSPAGGEAVYLATIPDDGGMRALTAWAADRAGVAPEIAGLSEWVEVARRGDVLTLINHGPDKVTVAVAGTDLVTGAKVTEVTLGHFDWVLVRVANPG